MKRVKSIIIIYSLFLSQVLFSSNIGFTNDYYATETNEKNETLPLMYIDAKKTDKTIKDEKNNKNQTNENKISKEDKILNDIFFTPEDYNIDEWKKTISVFNNTGVINNQSTTECNSNSEYEKLCPDWIKQKIKSYRTTAAFSPKNLGDSYKKCKMIEQPSLKKSSNTYFPSPKRLDKFLKSPLGFATGDFPSPKFNSCIKDPNDQREKDIVQSLVFDYHTKIAALKNAYIDTLEQMKSFQMLSTSKKKSNEIFDSYCSKLDTFPDVKKRCKELKSTKCETIDSHEEIKNISKSTIQAATILRGLTNKSEKTDRELAVLDRLANNFRSSSSEGIDKEIVKHKKSLIKNSAEIHITEKKFPLASDTVFQELSKGHITRTSGEKRVSTIIAKNEQGYMKRLDEINKAINCLNTTDHMDMESCARKFKIEGVNADSIKIKFNPRQKQGQSKDRLNKLLGIKNGLLHTKVYNSCLQSHTKYKKDWNDGWRDFSIDMGLMVGTTFLGIGLVKGAATAVKAGSIASKVNSLKGAGQILAKVNPQLAKGLINDGIKIYKTSKAARALAYTAVGFGSSYREILDAKEACESVLMNYESIISSKCPVPPVSLKFSTSRRQALCDEAAESAAISIGIGVALVPAITQSFKFSKHLIRKSKNLHKIAKKGQNKIFRIIDPLQDSKYRIKKSLNKNPELEKLKLTKSNNTLEQMEMFPSLKEPSVKVKLTQSELKQPKLKQPILKKSTNTAEQIEMFPSLKKPSAKTKANAKYLKTKRNIANIMKFDRLTDKERYDVWMFLHKEFMKRLPKTSTVKKSLLKQKLEQTRFADFMEELIKGKADPTSSKIIPYSQNGILKLSKKYRINPELTKTVSLLNLKSLQGKKKVFSELFTAADIIDLLKNLGTNIQHYKN